VLVEKTRHKVKTKGFYMGRGKQKAKNTKIARDLKYYSPDTDYESLEKELHTDKSDDDYLYDNK
jgi:hypothetical protein